MSGGVNRGRYAIREEPEASPAQDFCARCKRRPKAPGFSRCAPCRAPKKDPEPPRQPRVLCRPCGLALALPGESACGRCKARQARYRMPIELRFSHDVCPTCHGSGAVPRAPRKDT